MTIFRVIGVAIGISVIACGDGNGGTGGTGGDGGNGGGGNPSIDTLFPADNDIGTWVIDDVHGEGTGAVTNPDGVEVANDNTELVGLINGGADPFTDRNFVQFGREYYTDGTYEARVWMFEMPDAAVAEDLYDALFALPLYDYMTTAATAGDEARAGDTGLVYNLHGRKGEYFIMIENVLNDTGGLAAGEGLLAGIADGL